MLFTDLAAYFPVFGIIACFLFFDKSGDSASS